MDNFNSYLKRGFFHSASHILEVSLLELILLLWPLRCLQACTARLNCTLLRYCAHSYVSQEVLSNTCQAILHLFLSVIPLTSGKGLLQCLHVTGVISKLMCAMNLPQAGHIKVKILTSGSIKLLLFGRVILTVSIVVYPVIPYIGPIYLLRSPCISFSIKKW